MSSSASCSINNKVCNCLRCFMIAKQAQQQSQPAIVKKEERVERSEEPSAVNNGWKGESQYLMSMCEYLNPAVVKVDENGNVVISPSVSSPSILYKYKTVMCKSWLLTKACSYEARCKFAHGEHELRQMINVATDHPKYKTKPCKNFTITGLCPFGSRCLFIHPIKDQSQVQRSQGMPAASSSYVEKNANIRRIWEPVSQTTDRCYR